MGGVSAGFFQPYLPRFLKVTNFSWFSTSSISIPNNANAQCSRSSPSTAGPSNIHPVQHSLTLTPAHPLTPLTHRALRPISKFRTERVHVRPFIAFPLQTRPLTDLPRPPGDRQRTLLGRPVRRRVSAGTVGAGRLPDHRVPHPPPVPLLQVLHHRSVGLWAVHLLQAPNHPIIHRPLPTLRPTARVLGLFRQ